MSVRMSLRGVASSQKLAALAGVLAVACLIAASTFLPVQSWALELASRLHGLGLRGALLFGAIYIAGAMALVPASAFSLAAGLIFGSWGILLSWVAMMVVAATSFPVARQLLADRINDIVRERRLLRTVAEVVDEEGWRMVLLVRISGIVPFGLQNYGFGVMHIPFWPYLLATSVGVLPSILIYAGAGALGNAAADAGRYTGLRMALLTAAVLAGAAVIVITARKVRRRLNEQ
jgi:uncharacterized membrane protein YdjX (TVP38/TMEM64 family)